MDNRNKDHQANTEDGVSRREFIRLASLTSLSLPLAGLGAGWPAAGVALIADPADAVAASAPVQWAMGELEAALKAGSVAVSRFTQVAQVPAGQLCVLAAGAAAAGIAPALRQARVQMPDAPEALALAPVRIKGRAALAAVGSDAPGLVYALLELADRVRHSTQPGASLSRGNAVVEQPATQVRSLTRLFVSEVEDKPWYNDRAMWPEYLTLLATQRFNRFNLCFGIGYDFLRNVTDAYFLFAYPFLLQVPGYNVRAVNLPDAERDSNLKMLQYISEQTVARGMQFQLGLWMHGYEWINSPHPNYTIEGLNKENHGAYCRDAVKALLQACPAISGVTFRIHGESGVNEGSYDFWKTIFSGVAACGRPVEIDMHAKGMDQTMMDAALATGLPITISPKYWAEHLGMPYHQADIRALEMPQQGKKTSVLMNLSEGSRSFMRYGYGDLLREDRKYKVLHRIWPGTQRLLLWGDPAASAAYAQAFSFCGSAGVELMEPLSFKGRRGSGIAGDRCGYADDAYKPRWDWQKYAYSLRVFGRLLYNPACLPEVWKRPLKKDFGAGAEAVEQALAHASRILPIVLTTHGASAGNNSYWPEMYTNHSMLDPAAVNPYTDSPAPKVFGNVSPIDPQLFQRINDFASALLKGERSGKYSPVEVAQWLEDEAGLAARYLEKAAAASENKTGAAYRRMAVDVSLQIGLGQFFAAKFRAGVLYALFEQSGDRLALEASLKAYRQARQTWAALAESVRTVYQPDITAGELPHLRGHWLDRLPAIDHDIELMTKKLEGLPVATQVTNSHVLPAIREALGRPHRISFDCHHTSPLQYKKGENVAISIGFNKAPRSATLYYRHVNQAERFTAVEMQKKGEQYSAVIPASYTGEAYPLQYYFELRDATSACLHPGFNATHLNQPYFVLRQV